MVNVEYTDGGLLRKYDNSEGARKAKEGQGRSQQRRSGSRWPVRKFEAQARSQNHFCYFGALIPSLSFPGPLSVIFGSVKAGRQGLK